jgi:hypothetical protein
LEHRTRGSSASREGKSAHLEGAFVSEEIITCFPDDRCNLHVLAHHITEAQHLEVSRLLAGPMILFPYMRRLRRRPGAWRAEEIPGLRSLLRLQSGCGQWPALDTVDAAASPRTMIPSRVCSHPEPTTIKPSRPVRGIFFG